MRSCTQVNELSLAVKADFFTFRQILNQFYFVRLSFFFHESNRIFSGFCETLNLQILFNDLFHLCFDLAEIITGQRSIKLHIIVETICDRRSDCQLGVRIETFYSLCHHMACGMAKCCQTFLILCSQDIQLTILLQNGSQVNDLSIYLSGTGYTCQTLTQVFCNIDYRHCLCIFFD